MTKYDVLVVGNCIIDQVMHLQSYPQQDEETRAIAKTQQMGGNACNSAQVLVEQGYKVHLMGSFAHDDESDWLKKQLSEVGISTELCKRYPEYSTPTSSVWLNRQSGTRTIVHYRDLPELTLSDLKDITLDNYRWIHFEGRNIDVLKSFLLGLSDNTVPVSLEIEKPRDGIEQLLPLADTVIVSSHYLREKELSAIECLHQFKQHNAKLKIVCTLGAEGLMAMDQHGTVIEMAAIPVERVLNSNGAGDCFIAGLISEQLRQDDFRAALAFANRLAAEKIQSER